VLILGEEVAQYNGAYKVTEGLLKKFGNRQCQRWYWPRNRSPHNKAARSALQPCFSHRQKSHWPLRRPPISSSGLPVFRHENGLLTNKEQVERSPRFSSLLQREIQSPSDASDCAKHRQVRGHADRLMDSPWSWKRIGRFLPTITILNQSKPLHQGADIIPNITLVRGWEPSN
jgi:hypothetical protein